MSKLIIRSARDSFRRAGISFTREGVVVDEADLTTEQLEAILADPQLGVSPLADAAGDDDNKTPAPTKSKGKK